MTRREIAEQIADACGWKPVRNVMAAGVVMGECGDCVASAFTHVSRRGTAVYPLECRDDAELVLARFCERHRLRANMTHCYMDEYWYGLDIVLVRANSLMLSMDTACCAEDIPLTICHSIVRAWKNLQKETATPTAE